MVQFIILHILMLTISYIFLLTLKQNEWNTEMQNKMVNNLLNIL